MTSRTTDARSIGPARPRTRTGRPTTRSGEEMSLSHGIRRDRSKALLCALLDRLLPPLAPVPAPPSTGSAGVAGVAGVAGTGCPRCGGYVYHGSVAYSGSVSASQCVNCGWQGIYCGQSVEEHGQTSSLRRWFDPEAIAERVRAQKRQAVSAATKARRAK